MYAFLEYESSNSEKKSTDMIPQRFKIQNISKGSQPESFADYRLVSFDQLLLKPAEVKSLLSLSKLSHQAASLLPSPVPQVSFHLVLKTLQYNEHLKTLRKQHTELNQRITRILREEDETRDALVDNFASGYEVLFERTLEDDEEVESKAWQEVFRLRDDDQRSAIESLQLLAGVNERVKDLQNWQKVTRSLKNGLVWDQA